jgi:hypothetical protein
VHVVVDACKSYFLAFERGAAGTRQPHPGHFVDALGPDLFPRVGFVLSTSSGTDSHEWEEFQGGVFSHEVRSALRGAADADGDGAISYAELGAFVARANAAVPNARFRPQLTVVPPRDPAGLRASLLRWPRDAHARALTVDVPLDRFYVEDERGRRLADAHPAAPGMVLRVPPVPLYVREVASAREFAVAAGSEPLALSTLTAEPVHLARRGALQQSFRELFALSFQASDVSAVVAAPPGKLDAPVPPASERLLPRLRWAAVGVAVATALAGGGCTLGASLERRAPASASQAELSAANGRIDQWNGAAIGLYVASGASIATAILTAVVPRLQRSRARLTGAGTAGLGVAVALP